ncbi:hypothetical protein CRG98_015428 [Punica granatum]|uniref:Uncharacterized protein n=1 Tax=Punica granatum TaxID=22663 RepID=A0A2I0K6M1_PUNGR|nr:hypothetical protein CRG98_015428 [Punica granatum]
MSRSLSLGPTFLSLETVDQNGVLTEAMMSEMRLEFEQVHERIDLMENKRVEQPPNAPNARSREKVQPRELRVEDKENYGAGFDEENVRDSVVSNRRHGGRFREVRNRENNNLGSVRTRMRTLVGARMCAFGSCGLGVSTFPWGRVTDTRERRSRHLSFYDPKVEGE